MSSTRDDDFDLEGLANTGVDDLHRPLDTGFTETAEELCNLFKRPLRGRQADPLRRLLGDLFETLKREHQVRTTLGGGHGVNLVDDDRLDSDQRLACRRGAHQIQRLRRGDQQVGRSADQLLAVVRRSVAGAHADLGHHERFAETLRGELDAHQRCPQVLLDVERQGAQRRDVEDASAM